MPLLTMLYTTHSAKRAEQAINLVAYSLPTILQPLEQRILEPPTAQPDYRLSYAPLVTDAENGGIGASGTAMNGVSDPAYAAATLLDRKAEAALRVLLQILGMQNGTRAWRPHVGRLFGLPQFFGGLTRRTLPLWARAVNAWLGLETPKAAVSTLLSGKLGKTVGWFASKASEAEAHADLLRRLSFALWIGEYNQYVGALQGMLIEKVANGFKFAQGSERWDGVRWVVQVQALLAMRVLAMRIAPEHLTALWPIAMAELQRILLAPHAARPALLLAACQLIDTVLTVLPDDFSPFGWMFVPADDTTQFATISSNNSLPPPSNGTSTPMHSSQSLATPILPPPSAETPGRDPSPTAPSSEPVFPTPGPVDGSGALPPAQETPSMPLLVEASSRLRAVSHGPANSASVSGGGGGGGSSGSGFAALLEPLIQLAQSRDDPNSLFNGGNRPPPRRIGLLRASPDGRRRPLLGLRTLQHASDLAPFAHHLRSHLAASALLPRATEADMPMLELLVGCEFLSAREAEAALAPHWIDENDPLAKWAAGGAGEEVDDVGELAAGGPPPTGTRYAFQRCTPHETL